MPRPSANDEAKELKLRIVKGRPTSLVAASLALLIAGGLGACGKDDKGQSSAQSDTRAQQAFLQAMVPHHQSALEMAGMAKMRGQHGDIKQIGVDIINGQQREIGQMRQIYKRLFGKPLKPDALAHAKLGLSPKQAGMDHMDMEMADLEKARPFDRAFIDAMVPHHQGAIRMARAVTGKAKDPELYRLAQSIIGEQSREITTMNEWRKQWYGAASPAGGVPSRSSGGGGGMNHQGHSM